MYVCIYIYIYIYYSIHHHHHHQLQETLRKTATVSTLGQKLLDTPPSGGRRCTNSQFRITHSFWQMFLLALAARRNSKNPVSRDVGEFPFIRGKLNLQM